MTDCDGLITNLRNANNAARIDLEAIKANWLRQCGSCDAGLPMDCVCPAGDPRNVIDALVAEVERLRAIEARP